MSLAKAVANAAAMLVLKAKNVAQVAEDTVLQNRVIAAATQCALSTSQLVACAKVRSREGRFLGDWWALLESSAKNDSRRTSRVFDKKWPIVTYLFASYLWGGAACPVQAAHTDINKTAIYNCEVAQPSGGEYSSI